MSPDTSIPPRMDRRTALKWMLTVAASVPLLKPRLLAGDGAKGSVKGYGTDPDLIKNYQPGELWPLTFTDEQRRTAMCFCDLMIPADQDFKRASQVGVVDFIDEWISAPYPQQQRDRSLIIEGLAWLDQEARRRFKADFHRLPLNRAQEICDDLCYEPAAKPEFKRPAVFFARYRDLTASGYYTTPEGTKDLRYVGNQPLAAFEGPPAEVLRQVGLLGS